MQVHLLPARTDNYIFVLREESGLTAVVDPGEAAPVRRFLEERDWNLDCIFVTHHHFDHVGGISELRARYGCKVYGSARDRKRIPEVTNELRGGDRFAFGRESVEVFAADGHTLGHILYWFPATAAVFVGDTLFSLGCGKLFEGNPKEMWGALTLLRQLPEGAQVYCAHEYTQENAEFARRVEPKNSELMARIHEVENLRARGRPTVPSSLQSEKMCNPFLRPESAELQASLGLAAGLELWEIFAATRAAKDRFDSGGPIISRS
jgi:hydroxyacylglutathione hydrolase